jgi:hypothetical protein
VKAWRELKLRQRVWVGADEMNRRNAATYLTVFAGPIAKSVLSATTGKD